MANCMIGFPNRFDSGLLTGGNWQPTLPIYNLNDRTIGRVARTVDTALTSTQFRLDMGVNSKALRAFSLVNHNLSLQAKYRLRGTNETLTYTLSRNNRMQLATPGTPGTLPTLSAVSNASRQVVAVGTEDGIGYMDIRLFSTSAPGLFARLTLPVHGPIVRDNHTLSCYVKHIGGTLPPGTSLWTSVSAVIEGIVTVVAEYGVPVPANGTGTLAQSRLLVTVPPPPYDAFNFSPAIYLPTTPGQAFDFTVRVALPQMEPGRDATSVIHTTGSSIAQITWRKEEEITYSYDSAWTDVWPVVYADADLEWEDDAYWSAKYTQEQIEGYNATLVKILPTNVVLRTWHLEIDDQDNPDGYVQIGRVFFGPVWQPAKNPSWGLGTGYESRTDVQESLGGAEYFQIRRGIRDTSFIFDNMSVLESLSKAFELDRQADVHKEVLWVMNPDDTLNAIRTQFLGRLRQLSKVEFAAYNANRKAYQIKELL